MTVEMWVTKDEKEQEKKRREDRQTKQLLNALLGNIGAGQPSYYQQRPQTQGNYQPRPQGGNQNYRGNNRGGRGGGRGGQGGYGGNRGGAQQPGMRPSPQQPAPLTGVPQAPVQQVPLFPLP